MENMQILSQLTKWSLKQSRWLPLNSAIFKKHWTNYTNSRRWSMMLITLCMRLFNMRNSKPRGYSMLFLTSLQETLRRLLTRIKLLWISKFNKRKNWCLPNSRNCKRCRRRFNRINHWNIWFDFMVLIFYLKLTNMWKNAMTIFWKFKKRHWMFTMMNKNCTYFKKT